MKLSANRSWFWSGLIATMKNFPPKTFAEFIAYAKQNPGKVRFSSVGVGSFPQYDMEILACRAGLDMVTIPNKAGASGVMNDLLVGTASGLLRLPLYPESGDLAPTPVVGFDGAFGDAFLVATAIVGTAAVLALARFRSLRRGPRLCWDTDAIKPQGDGAK